MGNCNSLVDAKSEFVDKKEKKINNEILNEMKKYERADGKVTKLLFIGAGSSGKSTIFKSIQSGQHQFTQETIDECLFSIRLNILRAIIVFFEKSDEVYQMDKIKYLKCKFEINDEISKSINYIVNFEGKNLEKNEEDFKELGECIDMVWNLSFIQETFKYAGLFFPFPENMEYFLNKVEDIMSSNYKVQLSDYLKTRIRTTGIMSYEYQYKSNKYQLIDVGGQRNERKKWVHSFHDVKGILFVLGLNHYCKTLFEDVSKNAMHEALELFHQISNTKWIRHSNLILFFNKDDLFKIKLKQTSLSYCFGKVNKTDYNTNKDNKWRGIAPIINSKINTKSNNFIDEGPWWNGPDYVKKENQKENETHFNECYNKAFNFIQNLFHSVGEKNRIIYSHRMCAIDVNVITEIIRDVEYAILSKNVMAGGFVSPI